MIPYIRRAPVPAAYIINAHDNIITVLERFGNANEVRLAHKNDTHVLVSVESIVVDTPPTDQNIYVVLQPKRLSSERHKKTVLYPRAVQS